MKRIVLTTINILLIISLGFSQKIIYQSKTFKHFSQSHKKIAILPFNVILELEEDLSKEELQKRSKQEGYYAQDLLAQSLKERSKGGNRLIEIQDIRETNAILESNNIDYDDLDLYTISTISKFLNVDAIISGRIITSQILSRAVAVPYDINSIITRKIDYGRLAIKISDGQTNKLIWRYEKKLDKKNRKNTDQKLRAIIKEVVRKFPYDSRKKPSN